MFPLKDNVPTRSFPVVTVGLIAANALVWFLGVSIGLQIWTGGLSLVHPGAGDGTAFFAHIGGFLFGLATILLVARQRPRAPTSRHPVY